MPVMSVTFWEVLMRFRVLGPLEVRDKDQGQIIPLAGTKQRATLGVLLLRANKVVATSALLDALWSDEEPPVTARKILHNAISALRRVLAADDQGAGNATLVTRPPGYLLMTDQDDVDLYVFHRLVGEGRADLSRGRPEVAVDTLRRALDLWRGPVLSDLAEAGISWPELVAVQNMRLDVLEDYFDAAMACGRQHEILRELEMMVANEPLRERACTQLMLVLYRNGRHADALDVYARTRTALVTELGLEPSRELQVLQRAILNHDPVLSGAPAAADLAEARTGTAGAGVVRDPTRPRRGTVAQGAAQNRRSVLLVRSGTEVGMGTASAKAGGSWDETSGLVHKTVRTFGGVPTVSLGSTSMAVFEMGLTGDGPFRAVRAAWEIRRQLDAGDQGAQIAVATGTALVHSDPERHGCLGVRGSAVDTCQALLAAAAGGELLVCPETRREAELQFTFSCDSGAPGADWSRVRQRA
jgi:DNA-binding SARP family transcriptional activator